MKGTASAIGSAAGISGVAGIFTNLLDKLGEARCIVISAPEGTELYSATKPGVPALEDSQTIAAFVPSYAASTEQAKRVNYGDAKYALSWIGGSVLIQSSVDNTFIISIMCDESINLGILDDYLETMHNVLTPLCLGFQADH